MERESQPESAKPPEVDQEKSLELGAPGEVEELPEALGFTETPELSQLRGQLVEAMAASSEEVRELATRYHLLAEEVVNQRQGADFAKAQVGLIIQMALMRRDGGRTEQYIEDLQDALAYARNGHLEDAAAALEAAIQDAEESARRELSG